MFFQIRKSDDLKGGGVSGVEHNSRRGIRVERFFPTACAQAPSIAWFQAREAVLRQGRAEVVSLRFGEHQELGRKDHANRVQSHILRSGITASIAIKAGNRGMRAGLKRPAKHVDRGRGATPPLLGCLVEHIPEYHREIELSTGPMRW